MKTIFETGPTIFQQKYGMSLPRNHPGKKPQTFRRTSADKAAARSSCQEPPRQYHKIVVERPCRGSFKIFRQEFSRVSTRALIQAPTPPYLQALHARTSKRFSPGSQQDLQDLTARTPSVNTVFGEIVT